MKKIVTSCFLVLILLVPNWALADSSSIAASAANAGATAISGQGGSAIISNSVNPSASAGVNVSPSALSPSASAGVKMDPVTVSTGPSTASLKLQQVFEGSDIPPNHIPGPAALFGAPSPQIFNLTLPPAVNNSLIRMIQYFPPTIRRGTANMDPIEVIGKSGKTKVVFYPLPQYAGFSGKKAEEIKILTHISKNRYQCIGGIYVSSRDKRIIIPLLWSQRIETTISDILSDATSFVFGEINAPDKTLLYLDPFGFSFGLGAKTDSGSLSLLANISKLNRNSDLAGGGGVGNADGLTLPIAEVGMNLWVLAEDTEGTEIELRTLIQPLAVPGAYVISEIPDAQKAKGAGIINGNK